MTLQNRIYQSQIQGLQEDMEGPPAPPETDGPLVPYSPIKPRYNPWDWYPGYLPGPPQPFPGYGKWDNWLPYSPLKPTINPQGPHYVPSDPYDLWWHEWQKEQQQRKDPWFQTRPRFA